MAKKSEAVENSRFRFARPNGSVDMSMGIVGLPNVGKSTLFNGLTKLSVRAENFSFCTVDPHIGHVRIDDPRVTFLAGVFKPAKTINSSLTIIDIAGLVKGSSEGVGLGNQFLDNIRNVDGIFLVCRCFEDPEIVHVEQTVDPIRDIDIIKDELRIKDIEHVRAAVAKVDKEMRGNPGDKKFEKNKMTVDKLLQTLASKWISDELWDKDEIAFINKLNLLTCKSLVILANISEKHYKSRKGNKHLKAVMDVYKDNMLVFSAVHVDEDGGLNPEFVKSLVDKGYEMLGLMNFFTVGKDEVRSWTVRVNSKAPEAARAIHTDFEKYFVSVDVMEYEEFVQNPSEAKMKAVGKFLQKGKDYLVKNGDILHFKANPPRSKK